MQCVNDAGCVRTEAEEDPSSEEGKDCQLFSIIKSNKIAVD